MVAGLCAAFAAGGCVISSPKDKDLDPSIRRLSATDALGREVSYLRAGPPDADVRVIFVHGTPGSAADLSDLVLDAVEDTGAEAVALDRPGFGKTGGEDVTFAGQAAALEPLLRADAKNVLVGHSLGGPIIAWAAADYPERVDGVVILAGSLSPELEKPRWFNHLGGTWLMKPLLSRSLRVSNDEIMAAGEQTALLSEKLGSVTAPVAIVHGTADGLVPFENVAFMRQAFTGADLSVTEIRGAGHLLPWQQEDEVRRAVAEMVRRVRAAPGGAGR